jgi:hypothetical protein
LHEEIAARGVIANIRLMPARKRFPAFDRPLYRSPIWSSVSSKNSNVPCGRNTLYDKRDDGFASVQLAAIRIWMKSNEWLTWRDLSCSGSKPARVGYLGGSWCAGHVGYDTRQSL